MAVLANACLGLVLRIREAGACSVTSNSRWNPGLVLKRCEPKPKKTARAGRQSHGIIVGCKALGFVQGPNRVNAIIAERAAETVAMAVLANACLGLVLRIREAGACSVT